MFKISSNGLPTQCIDHTHLKANSGIVLSIDDEGPDELGRVDLVKQAYNVSLNDIQKTGTYDVAFDQDGKSAEEINQIIAQLNIPSPGWGKLDVLKSKHEQQSMVYQLYHVDNVHEVYHRWYNDGTQQWSEWTRIDVFANIIDYNQETFLSYGEHTMPSNGLVSFYRDTTGGLGGNRIWVNGKEVQCMYNASGTITAHVKKGDVVNFEAIGGENGRWVKFFSSY